MFVSGYPDINNFCQISKINSHKSNGGWDYMVNFFDDDGYHSFPNGIHIDEDDIDRYLTADEILEYEIKISSDKYNI